MSALPFVFFTNELQILPTATLQYGHPPSTIQMSKHFFQKQIEDLKTEFSEVQSMGTATVEEWIKGLDGRGKERRNDAARWEKWEASGGVLRMRGTEQHEDVKSAAPLPKAASSEDANVLHQFDDHNSVAQYNRSLHLLGQIPSEVHQLPQPIQTSFRK